MDIENTKLTGPLWSRNGADESTKRIWTVDDSGSGYALARGLSTMMRIS